MTSKSIVAFGTLALMAAASCNRYRDPYAGIIEFNDNAETNVEVSSDDLAKCTFQSGTGKIISLQDFRGEKNVVLVITRGYVGSGDLENQGRGTFCKYCSTQAARLIANYDKFTKRDAEVLLVFPITRDENLKEMEAFADMARSEQTDKVPFPVVADLHLAAVEKLGIRADLAKPATYILDKKGDVRFAYVGETLSDRPSIKAMLQQLDSINED